MNKKCRVCGIELNPSTVYGGFMGLMYKIFFRSKDWEKFSTCQECRNFCAMGLDINEIREVRKIMVGKHE